MAVRAQVRVLAAAWVGHTRCWPPPVGTQHTAHSTSNTSALAMCLQHSTAKNTHQTSHYSCAATLRLLWCLLLAGLNAHLQPTGFGQSRLNSLRLLWSVVKLRHAADTCMLSEVLVLTKSLHRPGTDRPVPLLAPPIQCHQ
jgi:hypothetical protein